MSTPMKIREYQEVVERIKDEYGLLGSAIVQHIRELPDSKPEQKVYGTLNYKQLPPKLLDTYCELISYQAANDLDRAYYLKLVEKAKTPTDKRRFQTRLDGIDEVIQNTADAIKAVEIKLAPFYKDILTQIIGKYSPRRDVKDILVAALGEGGNGGQTPPPTPQPETGEPPKHPRTRRKPRRR